MICIYCGKKLPSTKKLFCDQKCKNLFLFRDYNLHPLTLSETENEIVKSFKCLNR